CPPRAPPAGNGLLAFRARGPRSCGRIDTPRRSTGGLMRAMNDRRRWRSLLAVALLLALLASCGSTGGDGDPAAGPTSEDSGGDVLEEGEGTGREDQTVAVAVPDAGTPSPEITLTDETMVIDSRGGSTLKAVEADGVTFVLDGSVEGVRDLRP